VGTASFEQGAAIEIDGRPHLLLRKVAQDLWQVEESRSKRIMEFTDDQLRSLYLRGNLRFPSRHVALSKTTNARSPAVDHSPEQWERAKVRRAYVMAILEIPSDRRHIIPVIRQTWEKLGRPASPPGASSVLRWKRKFLQAGRDITPLIEQNERKGNAKSRYPEEVEQIVQRAIDTRYLTQERGTIQDTLDKAIVDVKRENALRPEELQLPVPTRRLVRRLIGAMPAFDRCVARYGKTVAAKQFRSVQGHRITQLPLDRAEMDHSLLDLLVIDDATSLPLGRPWLTACLDDNTRTTLGMFVSFEPPSYFTVAQCLKQAILPKQWLRAEFPAIKATWDAHGVMRELVVDNGAEFHSASLENACYSLGIEIHYSPRKTPWFKGKIERFLGSLNRAVAHGAPGTTFHSIFEKEEYDSSKHAVVRYRVLKEILYTWIVDVYHQKPHRALNVAPAVLWAKSITPEEILVPEDPARLDAILGRSEVRRLTHKGIELDGLFYNSPDLSALRRKLGESIDVDVRVDAANIGKIVVVSPDNRELYSVSALRSDYASGLSAWQHRVCKRYAARELDRYSPDAWLEAKQRIADLIEVEFARKGQKTRTRMARYHGDAKLLGHATDDKFSTPAPPRNGPADRETTSVEQPTSASDVGPVEMQFGPDQSVPEASTSSPVQQRRFKPIYRERVPPEATGGEEKDVDGYPQEPNR
jgi:putative transposase